MLLKQYAPKWSVTYYGTDKDNWNMIVLKDTTTSQPFTRAGFHQIIFEGLIGYVYTIYSFILDPINDMLWKSPSNQIHGNKKRLGI